MQGDDDEDGDEEAGGKKRKRFAWMDSGDEADDSPLSSGNSFVLQVLMASLTPTCS